MKMAKRSGAVKHERDMLADDVTRISAELESCYSTLSFITEDELTDAVLYKIKSLEAEFAYVFKKIKEFDVG